MDACHFCGNKHFTETKVQYIYKKDGDYLMIDNVPCNRCDYCGETYYHAGVLKKIEAEFEAIYGLGKKPPRELRIPVEDFLELSAA